MKKIISFIISAVIVAGMTGCSDYLDVKPRGYDVPHKLAHFEGLLYGQYKDVMFKYHYGTFEHTIDAPGYLSFFDTERQGAAKAYTWQHDIYRDDDECGEWNTPCSMFYTFNMIVDDVMNAEDGTERQKRAVQAEARFMRAWYTYMMAQFFGKPYNPSTAATDLCVPIIRKASTVGTDFSRRTVADVYDYVLTEMTEALPYLVERTAHQDRVFHTAGNAMLGKVLWMMGKYDDALPFLEAAKKALDNDSGKRLIDLGQLIDVWGEFENYPNLNASPETIFLIQGMPNLWTALGPMMGKPMRTLRTDVIEDYFDQDDYRLAFFTGVDSWETAYVGLDPDDRYYTNMSRMASNEGITVPDVYLMYAECLAREGELGDAKNILEELRKKRMDVSLAEVPAEVSTRDDLIRFAVAERIRENFGAGITWYDMRRLWNDPLFTDMKSYYTRTDGTNTFTLTEARLTLRIPPSVMAWHPEYVQNE